MSETISEAENLLTEENVKKYSELYNLGEEATKIVLESYIEAKKAMILCGGDKALSLELVFYAANGTLDIDWVSKIQMVEGGVTQTREASREEADRKRKAAEDELSRKAHEKLHGVQNP